MRVPYKAAPVFLFQVLCFTPANIVMCIVNFLSATIEGGRAWGCGYTQPAGVMSSGAVFCQLSTLKSIVTLTVRV